MVNGPRPAKLAAPSSSPNAPATNGATPARSPLFLQRQSTSVYSTVTSIGTPVLVYGKAATPLAGAWSAEPWNPEEVAAAPMPGALEDPRPTSETPQLREDTATVDDVVLNDNDDTSSSVAETAAFTDNSYVRSPVQVSAPAAIPTTTNAAAAPKHVAFKYRFDPYAPAGAARRETFRCDCDACVDAGVLGSDRLIGAHYDTAAYYATDGDATAAASFDCYATSETAAFNDDATSAAGMSWGATAEMEQQAVAVTEIPVSSFIPPPPPPRIARSIISESAEGALDADAAFYHIAMRWYKKVAAVQEKHVTSEDDFCPKPAEDADFDEWVHAAGRWWLRHFEHSQVKSTPSSGLLRTAAPVAAARPASAAPAAGFETHTNVSESFANHRHALRSGPRKTFGSSNLNASMLAGLGSGKPSSLPAPRSSVNRLEQLPW